MKVLDLFSGIGGFSLAASWLGWETVQFVEIDKFCQKVLNKHWPNVPIHSDIKTFDGTRYRNTIDIICGGFPCQPYSAAGKRLGTADDRHLWPEMLRVISEIQPGWVVGENVRGLTNWNGGLVFDQVQADLEAEGYEVLPFLLPACAVNAPHRRDRIWFVAYSNDGRRAKSSSECGKRSGKWESDSPLQFSQFGITPNSEGLRINREKKYENNCGQSGERWRRDVDNASKISGRKIITDTGSQGCEGGKQYGTHGGKERECSESYRPTSELHQISNWSNFPTQSPLCDRNDGLSDRLVNITFPKWRNESIKAFGNSIVPQVVYEIFKAINEFEQPLNNQK